MAARAVLGMLVLACAVAARADLYRCEGPGGSTRFTGDPSRCRDPVRYEPARARPGSPPADAPDAGAEPEVRERPPVTGLALQRLLPPAGGGWETLDDPPETTRDPELAAQGLRASVARHYTRARGPVSEVCTIELWSFARASQARAVGAGLGEPLWWRRAAGPLLVLAHGVRLERQVGARQGLVPGCEALAERAHARAATP